MRLELELRLEALALPGAEARPLVEALIRECLEADGYDPRLRFDTHLNADPGMPAWLLAWASPPGASRPRLLVGAASAFAPSRAEGEIRACVAPAFRRQGVFKLLYRGLEARLRHAGAESVLVVCEEASPSGAAIAARLGASLDHRESLMVLAPEALAAARSGGSVRLVPVTGELLDEEASVSSAVFGGTEEQARAFCEAALADPSREAFLAMAAEGPVGLLGLAGAAVAGTASAGGARAMVYGLGIVPAYRRRGYGRDALLACLEVLGRRGVREVELEVDADNAAAIALYGRAGFEERSRADYWRLAGAGS